MTMSERFAELFFCHPQNTSHAISVESSDAQGTSGRTSPAASVVMDEHIQLQLNLSARKINLNILPAEIISPEEMEERANISDEEMERLRNVVVVKTYSNLVSMHKNRTPEEMKMQMKDVQAFGKALFKNIRGSDTKRKYITLNDFNDFYGDDKNGKEQALLSFNLFAINPLEKVTKDKVVDSVLEIFKERANIAASLGNTESMMDSLHAGLAGKP
eukprot:scaffold188967_cov50-Prasinocladus_malaysianus.AAC.1